MNENYFIYLLRVKKYIIKIGIYIMKFNQNFYFFQN